MKFGRSDSQPEEPEIVGRPFSAAGTAKNSRRSYARRVFTAGAKTFAANYAVNQAKDRVDGLKNRIVLVALLYTTGILLGIIALISLIGWALFSILPAGWAGVILGIIVAPIVIGLYVAIRTARSIWKHPLAKQAKKDFDSFRKK